MSEEIDSSTLAGILLASPHTVAGKRHGEGFVYSRPFFDGRPKHFIKEDSGSDDDSPRDLRYNDVYIAELQEQYSKLRDCFCNNRSLSSLYIIIGSSGCGKTTLSKELISKVDNPIVNEFDFEKATNDNIDFLTETHTVDEVNPVNAMILIILNFIGGCFAKPGPVESFSKEKINDLIKKISAISDVYDNYFNKLLKPSNDSSIYKGFFKHLKELSSSEDIGISGITSHIYGFIKREILEKGKKNEREREDDIYIRRIHHLTGILLRLYFCVSKTEETYKDKRYILFVDNIEHSILLSESEPLINIVSSHIQIILHGIHDAVKEIGIVTTNMSGEEKKPKPYTVLLAMRDSTYGILQEMKRTGTLAENGDELFSLEISDWYDVGEILSDRVKHRFKYDSIERLVNDDKFTKTPGVITYCHITSDRSHSQWGLNTFISRFYNNSKRYLAERLVSSFLSIYEQPAAEVNYNGELVNKLVFFNNNWESCIGFNGQNEKLFDTNRKLYDAYVQLCRKYFIRLLLDHVNYGHPQHDKHRSTQFSFFEKTNCICPSERNDSSYNGKKEACSYTRRILTYLAKQFKEKNQFKFVTIGQIIRDLLIHNSTFTDIREANIDDTQMELFSDILFYLNEIRSNDTKWTGLIYIEVPGGKAFKIKDLRAYIKKAWDTYVENHGIDKENIETVTIQVTDAGDLFSRFMSDFEYFACRYAPNSLPLLAIDNDKDLSSLLNNVFEAVKRCFEKINDIEKGIAPKDIKWNLEANSSEKKHSKRIIDRHIGYMGNFQDFLESSLCKLPEKKLMAATLAKQIDEYKKLKI